MTHALVTIVAPLDPARLPKARDAIEALGNPAWPSLSASRAFLDGDRGIHFVSLHALPSLSAVKAHLILELNGDGEQAWAIRWLAKAIGDPLMSVFEHALDWRGEPIERY